MDERLRFFQDCSLPSRWTLFSVEKQRPPSLLPLLAAPQGARAAELWLRLLIALWPIISSKCSRTSHTKSIPHPVLRAPQTNPPSPYWRPQPSHTDVSVFGTRPLSPRNISRQCLDSAVGPSTSEGKHPQWLVTYIKYRWSWADGVHVEFSGSWVLIRLL